MQPLESFEPFWDDANEQWKFKSKVSGNDYNYEFLIAPFYEGNKAKYLYDNFVAKVHEASRYSMMPDFLMYWLGQIVLLNAVYIAEDAYQDFIKENKKMKPAKLYKQADLVYDQAYENYSKFLG